ncbi:microsomal signal peptidase 12 kDa subunit-domain-containing protein [Globomyces pollinis-pini]|nr:microsomal signal peptidase 12 kDa subunit-domain-containing protein [Globomyces pollinis-pini]
MFQGGEIDFKGQELAHTLLIGLLALDAVLSFIIGYSLDSMKITIGSYILGLVLILIITVLPLPMYNSNNIKWVKSKLPKKQPLTWTQYLKKLLV